MSICTNQGTNSELCPPVPIKAVSWAPLGPFLWVAESENTMPFGSNSSKYQADRVADRKALLFLSVDGGIFSVAGSKMAFG
ncbi:hypothetical protein AA106_17090 [Photorhabdus laumondii subsp. laumondii]|nr:hypothetical protein A4R40_02630 [Photorhabdus laumondii subsp. laumondii]KTL59478.1 hypothetical protein AA106_17090 [Photorhabdus laumondii subsp. laumondii]